MTALNLRQIEVFRAVMTAGTIAGASQMLFVSKPAVSRLLSHTEQRIGFALFERIKGRLYATPEAKRLFHEVEEVYGRVQRVNELAADLARNHNGILNLVSSPSVGQRFIPEALSQFRQKHPDSKITFCCHNYEHLSDRLLKHQADLGVVSMPIEHPNLTIVPLCVSRLMCVLPDDHPLGEKAQLTLDDVLAYPMIGYGYGTRLERKVADYYAAKGFQQSYSVEVASPQNAVSLVEIGMGLALVDAFSACSGSSSRPVMVRPMIDAPELQASLVHPRYEPVSQLTQSFVAILRRLLDRHGFALLGDAEPLSAESL
ncbi:LysR substrate-binding domain-containing protein [Robbsia andropogonis]|uniref:LysR substrate-binding domain-containing protein n=1 Tax=Robbsia andropogonis TaxID=28092 RepID=UPI00389A8099